LIHDSSARSRKRDLDDQEGRAGRQDKELRLDPGFQVGSRKRKGVREDALGGAFGVEIFRVACAERECGGGRTIRLQRRERAAAFFSVMCIAMALKPLAATPRIGAFLARAFFAFFAMIVCPL
jgi:hypothetical protein